MKDNKANENNENYQEYLRLKNNPDYLDVTFDEQSGGLSAIHKKHRFDKQMGVFGIKKGDYERIAIEVLRKGGHQIFLESELAPNGVKTPDGNFDGAVMDIKAVEGNGKWAIKDKLHDATKQGVTCVILYFHNKDLYKKERIDDGWNKYLNDESSNKYPDILKRVICIVEREIIEYEIP